MPDYKSLTPDLAVTGQIQPEDMADLAKAGFHSVINNRPDQEAEGQPDSATLEKAATEAGLAYFHLPVRPGEISDEQIARFADLRRHSRAPTLAFCRTGTRSTTLWALSESHHLAPETIQQVASQAGYDLSKQDARLRSTWQQGPSQQSTKQEHTPARTWDVLIVGGGAGGLAAAASLLKRRPSLNLAVLEPQDTHYYQPAWTLVGGGAFRRADTARPMATVMPRGAKWIRGQVVAFEPEHNQVVLEDGDRIAYRQLVVAPGLTLDLDAVEGLREGLGHNGVTSNYLFDYAPYTWECVQNLNRGRALFTQPPMPIKCAGAPQKALYLSCHHWEQRQTLSDIDVHFHVAGGVLFGVPAFVPPLMEYINRYHAKLDFNSNLKAVDAGQQKAWFTDTDADGNQSEREETFDLLHVTPPQKAPDFVANSPLANDAGWLEADAATLQHPRYANVFAIGDVSSTANAKTAAAVRKQAPVLAENLLAVFNGKTPTAHYDGYGACPLTVEKGKVILAEFGYQGALQSTFPLDPTKARKLYWLLKANALPRIYFDLMLKGHEWLTGSRA